MTTIGSADEVTSASPMPSARASNLADFPKRLIDLHEVINLTAESKTVIYEKLADSTSKFPKPVKHGRCNRWVLGEVTAYIDQRIRDRDVELGVSA